MKPTVREIGDNFFMITLPMPFRLNHVNVFVSVHDGHAVLFDTGPYIKETFSALEASLNMLSVSMKDIDRIFLTHFHADHSGIAGMVKKISGASIHMTREDYRSMNNYNSKDVRLNYTKTFCIQQGFAMDKIDILAKDFAMFRDATVPFEVEEFLEPDQAITVGNIDFDVISTPGHARGHVCFFFRKESILLSGDHVLPHITPNLSPDLFVHGFYPLRSYLDSLSKIKAFPATGIYPAHGAPFIKLKERVEEIEEHHRQRMELILESVQKEHKTAYEVSLDIFGKGLPEFDKFLALNETYVHLIDLEGQEMIKSYRKNGRQYFYAM